MAEVDAPEPESEAQNVEIVGFDGGIGLQNGFTSALVDQLQKGHDFMIRKLDDPA